MLNETNVVEIHSDTATLYLRGALTSAEIPAIQVACERLPRAVRILRIDLHGVIAMEGSMRDAIIEMLRAWRRDRLGLVFIAGGVEAFRRLATRSTFDEPAARPPQLRDEALMAVYL